MKYKIIPSKRFEKDMKRCQKRGYNMQLIKDAIILLAKTGTLPSEYKPHQLHGDRKGQWECHIQPDWLLIWEQRDQELILVMLNTGTHSDLFSKKYKK
ncbi:MAG: type II toxin-antitoxin system YafQ family toxin [Bacteroidaceae bacterium]|nr:type II toxin-antitoxin system YafQ family toxin [Bacteroidaceae bacterium]